MLGSVTGYQGHSLVAPPLHFQALQVGARLHQVAEQTGPLHRLAEIRRRVPMRRVYGDLLDGGVAEDSEMGE
jgi:hypothetical protein